MPPAVELQSLNHWTAREVPLPTILLQQINVSLCLLQYFLKFIFAVLGLHCCLRAFSICVKWGLLFVVLRRLLITVTSHCGARALGARASVVVAHRLSSCGSRALERRLSSCGARA